MQPTIAVVEDEGSLREAVAEYLGDRGFRVLCAANAAEMRSLMQSEAIDLAILDIAMPGEDGLTLARWLRTRSPKPGIIFATAAGSAIDRIVGLEIGADDYMVKPYELRELLARVRSVLRRLPQAGAAPAAAPAEPTPAGPRVVQVGACRFNLDNRSLLDAGGQRVELTAMEADLLAAFVARPNRVLTRSQLLELAHGRSGEDNDRSIDIRVTRLRKKIEVDPENPSLIRTMRGEGYMFSPSPP